MKKLRQIEKRLILVDRDSWFITDVRYANGHLYVKLGRHEYVHEAPRSVFREMARTPNILLFYNSVVRRHYPHIEQESQ